ncbi:MAG: hydantoinase/oxoprolinase family protein, partial [Planctomycetaceae bacterium]|nr:hydantoinase/oxoprolinase family protein [Planctomycetaceae bacterium]
DSFTYELDCGLPAPVLAIRWLLALRPDATCPPVRLRFGTTRGTNALLTRSGARTALVTTKGFGDVPLIGNQDRPDLFALDIVKPEPLFCRVIEVDERMTTDGTVLRPLTLKRSHSMEADCQPDAGPPSVTACVRTADAPVSSGADLRNQSLATSSNESLTTWLKEQLREVDSVAICLMNAFANPRHEIEIEQRIRELGVEEVSRSSEVSPLIRYVPRCDTTVLDAYLNPVLRAYMNDIRRLLPASEIQVMTSNGGLVNATAFRGRDCVLSGPAGGIVGFSSAATADGFSRAIGFDMGGTSTDVARYEGQFEYQTETVKAGVRIATPVLAIETVAAGGGSICGFDGTRLFVGPQSAGAAPGPACYGAGGPLTVTDLNVFLGRLIPDRFPFPLNVAAVDTKLREVLHQMKVARAVDEQFTLHMLAEGLLEIANDNMSQAIRRVSIARGYHPEEYVLVSFGGAGGQHACSIARRLGIRKILIHPAAGILSAFGMGQADIRVLKQQSVLKPLDQVFSTEVIRIQKQLETQAEREVLVQHPAGSVSLRMSLQLRYIGTDSTISVDAPTDGDFRRQFEQNHQRLFGYIRPNHAIEIAAMTVEAVSAAQSAKHDFGRQTTSGIAEVPEKSTSGSSTRVEPSVRMWWNGTEVHAVVVNRADCRSGDRIHGPAILCESTSTTFIEP